MIQKIPERYWLIFIILLSFVIRLVYSWSNDPLMAYHNGGDSGFYLQVGRDLVGGYDYSQIPLPVPPVYLLIVGIPQQFFSPETSIYLIWILQSLLLSVSYYFVFDITKHLTGDKRAAFTATIALATSISFTIEASPIRTEAVYIFFTLLALQLYIAGFLDETQPPLRRTLLLLLSAVVLGLAALTRPVLILFPLGIVIHMLIIKRWRTIFLFLIAYAVILFSWTAYTSLYYEWTVIGSNQLFPAIWRGAVEGDGSPAENDALLGSQTALEQTTNIVSNNPSAFIKRRFRELTYSYVQPHGTIAFGDESLKTLTSQWVNSGFSPSRLWQLLTGDGFIVKLLIYIWHYLALLGGLIGMWLTRKKWQISLVLIGFIVYTTLLHFVILALPRYIFPTYPFFWIFASVTLVAVWDRFRVENKEAEINPPPA